MEPSSLMGGCAVFDPAELVVDFIFLMFKGRFAASPLISVLRGVCLFKSKGL